MSALINLICVILIYRFLKKHFRRGTILGKCLYSLSRPIHRKLDSIIKHQRDLEGTNVVEFKRKARRA
jgi:hypothetical protein